MFINKFDKLPERTEKEPLRPLYMYYKRLKQGIVALKTNRKASIHEDRQVHSQLISSLTFSIDPKQPPKASFSRSNG